MRVLHAAAFATAAAAASLAFTGTARADEPTTAARTSMEQYSRGERGESVGLVAAGAVSLATAGAAFADGGRLSRGVSVPLAVGGLYEVVSGISLYVRTSGWEHRAEASLVGDAPAFRERELSRLESARKRLGAAIVETALFAGGGFLAFFTSGSANDTLRGVGIGCAVEGATLLTFDAFAALRGDRYSTALRDIGFRVTPERSGATVSVQKSF